MSNNYFFPLQKSRFSYNIMSFWQNFNYLNLHAIKMVFVPTVCVQFNNISSPQNSYGHIWPIFFAFNKLIPAAQNQQL